MFSFQDDSNSAVLAAEDTALNLVDSAAAAPHASRSEATYDKGMLADAGILARAAGAPHHHDHAERGGYQTRSENRMKSREMQEADVSIFMSSSSSSQQQSTCTAGFVDCKDGFLASDSKKSCKDACGKNKKCCVDDGGDDACVGFTGKVCKDGSCNGYKACENANISSVVNSCVGRSACVKAGYLGGSIGNIVDSCKYEAAC